MATIQTLCSNPINLASAASQNLWTARTPPLLGTLTNAVITGFVLRDPSGIVQTQAVQVVVSFGGSPLINTVVLIENTLGAPFCFVANNGANSVQYPLSPNPTVTGQVQGTLGTGTVYVDVLGYFI